MKLRPHLFSPSLSPPPSPEVALTGYKALAWYAGAPWTAPPANDSACGVAGSPRAPRVLVLGGSGGTGSLGIALARALGAGAVAATTSAANFDYCARLGADRVIDYKAANWTDVFAPGELDVVYDTVGEAGTAGAALALLARGGRFVTIAGALAPAAPAGVSQASFINSDTNLDSAPQLAALAELLAARALPLPDTAIYALEHVDDAFATSAAGHVVGKLVISIANFTR